MNKLLVIGPDFPKCGICDKDMKSVLLSQVPQRSRKKMLEINWYKPLNRNYWYWCEADDNYIHKLALEHK
jgi:hypothetical protein